MYRVFQTLEDYNAYTASGTNLTAGDIYLVKDTKALFFNTNNLDGEPETYDYLDEIPEGYIIPTGNKTITANGNNIDVTQYASATVNVPVPPEYIIPSGNTTITENGNNIDVTQYASASVAVPIPEGYIVPTGNKTITENGNNIDVTQYASATVNVPVPPEYIIPSGNTTITENGNNIDVSAYATATVNVAGSGGNEDLINLIERDITSINIPSGVTSIGQQTFNGCSRLTSVTIPNSVTSIGDRAFYSCPITSIEIPNSVTSINNNAFHWCNGLSTVTIGNSVTSIGKDAFYYCTSLSSVAIEATTPPSLGSRAFDNNASGRKIYVPSQSVAAYKAATNWSSYASYIEGYETRVVATFNVYDTSEAMSILNENSTNQVDEIEIDGVVQPSVVDSYQFSTSGDHTVKYTFKNNTIGDNAFYWCTSLKSVTIPDNITSIGNSAFENCSLTSVTIGNGVTSIGNRAFNDNTELSDVTIGSGVTSIGEYAFSYIELPLSFTIKATTPPTIHSRAFYETWSFDGIYVPAASVDAYKAAENWSNYASYIQAIPA